MAKSRASGSPRVQNRKASHRFELLERVECGLALVGTEVKSLRSGKASLDEAHARIRDGEVWLIGMHIAPYEHGTVGGHDPNRPRKLLLRKREISKLSSKVLQKGLTLVPLQVYFNARGLAKLQLALARGKAQHDKRQDLKKRDHKREMDRALRRGR